MRRGEDGGLRGRLLDLQVRLAGKDEHTESRGQEPHLPVKVGHFDVAEALRLARAQKEHVRWDEPVAFGSNWVGRRRRTRSLAGSWLGA